MNQTRLRLSVVPRYPASVSATDGIAAQRDGPDIIIRPDYKQLQLIAGVDDPLRTYFMAFTESTGEYRGISFTSFSDIVSRVVYGPNLSSLNSLDTRKDTATYWTGNGQAATFTLSPFARNLLGSADDAAVRASLNAASSAQAVPSGGLLGEVLAKASSGNNDVVWSANAVTPVFNYVAPTALYFGTAPIIYDFAGTYGQARTFYFNRTFFARTVIGSFSGSIGTESTRLPGYTELMVPGTTTLYKVFIDSTTGEISIYAQNALPSLRGGLIPLFDVRNGIVMNESYPVKPVEGGIGGLYAFAPFVIESDGSVLIPRSSWNSRVYSTIRPAPTGMFEKEITALAPSATGQVLYFDQLAAAKGEDPYKVASNPIWPESVATFPLLAKAGSNAPYSNPKGIPLLGKVPGGSIPNIANIGKNNVENVSVVYRTTVPCDVTDASLIALGITRGFNDPTYQTPYYGGTLPASAVGSLLHSRFYVQSDVDNSFPSMQIRFRDAATGTISTVTATLERQISTRVASYFTVANIPANAVDFYFGTIGAAGRNIVLCGGQWHYGSKQSLWIMRDDYPAPAASVDPDPTKNAAVKQAILLAGDKSDGKLLYPNEMFLIEGREQKLYGDQLFETRTDGQDVFMTLEARSMMANNEWPLPASGKRELSVKGGALAASTALVTRTISQVSKDNRSLRELTVRTAGLTALAGSFSSALFIGDSLTEFTGYPQAAGRELAKAGMTLNFTGTVDIREADAATGGQNIVKGEGRGSRDIRNYTYQDGTGAAVPCDPFPDSFIATYLAMSTTDKKAYNPFLRPATGSDPADRVFNGHIFDMRFYLTRFGLPDPNFVGYNLGTNDINHGGLPAQSAAVATGIKVLIAQTLLALPNAYVGLVVNPLPRTVSGDSKWSQQVMLYKILQAAALARTEVDGAGRPRVSLIPAYAHCTPDAGYTETAGDTDPATGAKTVSMTDPLHYKGTVKEQVGRAVAAWIACRKVGA